ncbi:MAG: type III-B CRISPR module-associated protein Cmr5 [Burkholderiales bacterium]
MEQSLQQVRMRYAHRVSSSVSAQDIEEYASDAASLPADIRMSGLGQALAFYRAKGKQKAVLCGHVSDWLTARQHSAAHELTSEAGIPAVYAGASDVQDAIMDNDVDAYILATAEAMALMEWLKKLAAAAKARHATAQPATEQT